MAWVLVGLILGAIVYTVAVLGEYKTFLDDIQPAINRLEERGARLDEEVRKEATKREVVRARIEEESRLVGEMKKDILGIRAQIQRAEEEEQKLEMENYKNEFRRSKSRV